MCLDAQSQCDHVRERRGTLHGDREIASERTGQNRIGRPGDVVFGRRLIHAGDGGCGGGDGLAHPPQSCDRLAVLPHPAAQEVQAPQNTGQGIRFGMAPQFRDHVHAFAVHQREHTSDQLRVLRVMHTVEQRGGRGMAHFADLRRIRAAGDIVGHKLVELPGACGTRRAGVRETGRATGNDRTGTVMHVSGQLARPFECR